MFFREILKVPSRGNESALFNSLVICGLVDRRAAGEPEYFGGTGSINGVGLTDDTRPPNK